jgi:hypothetical protein
MQQYTLPYVLTPGAPSLFKDLPFNAALLLPVSLDVSLTAHPDFSEGCQCGDSSYFDEMYHVDPSTGDREVFIDHFYTWYEVEKQVREATLFHAERYSSSLSWAVGFVLGWLSALAFTDRALALRGFDLMVSLMK